MDLTEIIKNQDFFKNLINEKQKNTMSSALLFFCDDEVTASKVLVLTALLLEYPTFEMFNEQSAEFVKIEKNVDLDVKVYPKNNEKLLVSDSNEIVAEAYVKPVNLPNKIFIIKNFDVSTEEAQNKLLKILEEPPKNVYFLLHAKSEDRVLPTIKSRCDKIKINPLDEKTIENFSQNTLANILGGGYVGRTVALSKNEDLKKIVEFAVSLFTGLKTSKQVIKFSKTFLELKDNLNLILEVMSFCIEDIIKKDDLKDVEPEFSVEALCEISKLISSLREKVEFNANLTVAVDNFLLKILEVKYLCK